jgi:long-chain acyl-CoA synthetase
LGEEIKAVVQPVNWPKDPKKLEEELIHHCRQTLSMHKCPRSVDFVNALPRNEAGKLLKHQLRKQYWKDGSSPVQLA